MTVEKSLFSPEEQREVVLMNVTHYKGYADFAAHENPDSTDYNDFIETLQEGFYSEITLGTYNGASNVFHNREITDNHLIDAIWQDILNSDLFQFLQDSCDYPLISNNDYIGIYSEVYTVFTLNGGIFVDLD